MSTEPMRLRPITGFFPIRWSHPARMVVNRSVLGCPFTKSEHRGLVRPGRAAIAARPGRELCAEYETEAFGETSPNDLYSAVSSSSDSPLLCLLLWPGIMKTSRGPSYRVLQAPMLTPMPKSEATATGSLLDPPNETS